MAQALKFSESQETMDRTELRLELLKVASSRNRDIAEVMAEVKRMELELFPEGKPVAAEVKVEPPRVEAEKPAKGKKRENSDILS